MNSERYPLNPVNLDVLCVRRAYVEMLITSSSNRKLSCRGDISIVLDNANVVRKYYSIERQLKWSEETFQRLLISDDTSD